MTPTPLTDIRGRQAPTYWTDHNGAQWIEPTIRGRLKFKIPAHRALRDFVLHRDGYLCVECGHADRLNLLADHILSRRNGGRHHPDNLRCLCRTCNARKANTTDRGRPA